MKSKDMLFSQEKSSYVVVGDKDSDQYAFGSYGAKVKRRWNFGITDVPYRLLMKKRLISH